jgi:hypothetical protein
MTVSQKGRLFFTSALAGGGGGDAGGDGGGGDAVFELDEEGIFFSSSDDIGISPAREGADDDELVDGGALYTGVGCALVSASS